MGLAHVDQINKAGSGSRKKKKDAQRHGVVKVCGIWGKVKHLRVVGGKVYRPQGV